MTGSNPVHATSVMIGGKVLLLSGKSGSGKSDLALRLIDRGALLVSDDYTDLVARDGVLHASPPASIAGRIEIRGIGIVAMAFASEGPVALMIDLEGTPQRLPEETLPATCLHGIAVPTLALAAFESSAPIKAEQALLRHGLGSAS